MKKLFFFLSIVIFLSACSHNSDFHPRKVNYDRDVCAQCLMGIADQPYAVQAINSSGQVLWFDDIGCLVNYTKTPSWKKFINNRPYKIWVGNSNGASGDKWLELQKAYFTYGKHTPMGYGYSAVKTPSDSSFTFIQVEKRIIEGKTMREEFLKKNHMMGKGMKHNKQH